MMKLHYRTLAPISLILLCLLFAACSSERQDDTFQSVEALLSEPSGTSVLTTTPDSTLLPFQGRIAFVSDHDGNDEIYVMNADGRGQVRLTENDAFDGQPNWSPDGRRIAFVSDRDGNFEIYIMNADGSGQVRLTENDAFDGQPSWSPDGQRIAFASDRDGNDDIYVMNVDGSGEVRLTENNAFDAGPSWSPDGQRIVFSSTRDSPEDIVYVNSELYLMSSDSKEATVLTDNPAADSNPMWSPDGQQILFVSDRDSVRGRVSNLYLLELATRQVTQLITDDGGENDRAPSRYAPAWSPDSRFIAFVLDAGNPDIYVLDTLNGRTRRLTNSEANETSPAWSPSLQSSRP